MKKLLLTTAMALAALAYAVPASAQVTSLEDPIAVVCNVSSCPHGAANTPIPTNPPTGWGFTISGGPTTGTLFVDFLVPDSAVPQGGAGININLAGTNTLVANAQLFSIIPWTSGDLRDYLGNAATQPANPIGAYLPATLALLGNPANVNGYFVFQANLGTVTLPSPSSPGSTIFYDANKGAQGEYIVAFLQNATDFIGTENSGAGLITPSGNTINPVAAVPEPATWGMMLLGFIGLALAFRVRRRKVGFAA